jgi:hypothetical protein
MPACLDRSSVTGVERLNGNSWSRSPAVFLRRQCGCQLPVDEIGCYRVLSADQIRAPPDGSEPISMQP